MKLIKFVAMMSLLLVGPTVARSQSSQTGGTNSVATLQPGTNTNVGTYTFSQLGLYTNGQQNEFFQSLLNSCSPSTEFSSLYGGSFATDGITGCVAEPNTGTVLQVNGVAGYVNTLSTSSNMVGAYGQSKCLVTSCKMWGAAFLADDFGFAANTLNGTEIDVNARNASTGAGGPGQASGLYIHGAWAAQPCESLSAGGCLPAIYINKPTAISGGPYFWTAGIACGVGATDNSSGGGNCIDISSNTATNPSNSQAINFHSRTSGGVIVNGLLHQLMDTAGNPLLVFNQSSGIEGLESGTYESGGTQNISGCTLSSAVGGSAAGSFHAGATACTVTITPGITANNGFACKATDMTTAADANNLVQTATTTTTATMTGTVVVSDVITWSCMAF